MKRREQWNTVYGTKGEQDVSWFETFPIESDVAGEWSLEPMDIWHDRAVFHFLTTGEDRDRYRAHLLRTLKIGGSAIVATFALDGPQTCSGLPVQRYSPATLASEFGDDIELTEAIPHKHTTPWGSTQSFQYCRFTRQH